MKRKPLTAAEHVEYAKRLRAATDANNELTRELSPRVLRKAQDAAIRLQRAQNALASALDDEWFARPVVERDAAHPESPYYDQALNAPSCPNELSRKRESS